MWSIKSERSWKVKIMSYFFKTDKGLVRPINEDSTSIFKFNDGGILLLVLDGMGGHLKGDVASSMGLQAIIEECTSFSEKFVHNKKRTHTFLGKIISYNKRKKLIVRAIKKANKKINDLGTSDISYFEMGTTCIACYIYDNKVFIVNVGDSRCYALYGNRIEQLSVDQTYVQFLYQTGKIKKEEMLTHPKRHVLMNALGTYPSVTMDKKIINKEMNKILLCSDGLYNMVDEEKILKVLTLNKSTKEKVELLIDLANESGGKDNIAVALWEED